MSSKVSVDSSGSPKIPLEASLKDPSKAALRHFESSHYSRLISAFIGKQVGGRSQVGIGRMLKMSPL